MNDTQNWAQRMAKIGAYKRRELRRWLRMSTLAERLSATEQLLTLREYVRTRPAASPLSKSLSRMLEEADAAHK